MDLIYTDSDLNDVGVLQGYTIDLAFGKDENDFSLSVTTDGAKLSAKNYIYFEGTEYGGVIDNLKVDTAKNSVTYSGRTWQGILNSKVICPPSGQAYRIASGDANEVLETLINHLGLEGLFQASVASSGFSLSNYSFDRYIQGYNGIAKMLKSVGARLEVNFLNGKVVLSAVAIKDYTTNEEFDSSQIDFSIETNQSPVNHLICLGSGELADRQVYHVYVDEFGNISDTQHYTGLEEVVEVYDYPNAESLDELKNSGKERLQELSANGTIKLSLDAKQNYAVGDIVGGRENITKIAVKQAITKKIVTIKKGILSIQYEVGD